MKKSMVFFAALLLLIPFYGYMRPTEVLASTPASQATINQEILQRLLVLVAQLQEQLARLQAAQPAVVSNNSDVFVLTVTYPRGDEVFSEGQIVNIGWSPNGASMPGIKKIELVPLSSTARRRTLFSTARGDSPIYDGHFQVEMPRPTNSSGGGRYKIRVTDMNGKTDSSDIFVLNAKG